MHDFVFKCFKKLILILFHCATTSERYDW